MYRCYALILPPCEKAVLIAFAFYIPKHHDAAHASVARLAVMTGYSERQVQRALKALRQHGLLERLSPHDRGRGKAALYRLKGDRVSCFEKKS
jgi:DNA-binding transcriptional ArsR family regulator